VRAATRMAANFWLPISESDEAGHEKESLFRAGLLTCGVIF
jgi:hypothetical protein